MAERAKNFRTRTDDIQTTTDGLSDRGGLALFARYVSSIPELPSLIRRGFGSIRKNKKGLSVLEFFKQFLCFCTDGTSFHLTRFDVIAKDEGYAAAIETHPDDMASSHQVKRFFGAFSFFRNLFFPAILHWVFIWRLRIERPEVVLLNLDTMVMDNEDANIREGVEPTYKAKVSESPTGDIRPQFASKPETRRFLAHLPRDRSTCLRTRPHKAGEGVVNTPVSRSNGLNPTALSLMMSGRSGIAQFR